MPFVGIIVVIVHCIIFAIYVLVDVQSDNRSGYEDLFLLFIDFFIQWWVGPPPLFTSCCYRVWCKTVVITFFLYNKLQ